jgi:hypothetical protein
MIVCPLRIEESLFIDELTRKRPKTSFEKPGDSFRTHVVLLFGKPGDSSRTYVVLPAIIR